VPLTARRTIRTSVVDSVARRVLVCTLVVIWWLGAPLSAHVADLVTPGTVWTAWTVEPLVLTILVMTSWVYARGVRRLRTIPTASGRRISRVTVSWFAVGQLALIVALMSPLDALGATLLSAHMVQHAILAGVAPPLLLLGTPGVAFAWGLSGVPATRRLAPVYRLLGRVARVLATPIPAAVMNGLTIWFWHAPAMFDLAVEHEWVHAIQHTCFFLAATLLWRAVIGAHSASRAAGALAAAFATFIHTGLLGALITMAPEPLYPVYAGRTAIWGLSPLADQQLAGLLMWIPLGVPYVVAGLLLASSLVRRHGENAEALDVRGRDLESLAP
jgi:putative membrane protein